MTNRRGRRPKGSESNRTELLQVRLDSTEKQAFEDAAALAGLPLSTWVRERLKRITRRELEEAGHPNPFLKNDPWAKEA